MSTISTLNNGDSALDFRTNLNSNFSNLNADKLEASDISGKQDILAEGAFVDGDKTKLDGIEDSADVTDATNVEAAGALMDGDLGVTVQAYDVNTTKNDVANTFTATQTESISSGNIHIFNGTGINNCITRYQNDGVEVGSILQLQAQTDFIVRSVDDLYLTSGNSLTTGIVVQNGGNVGIGTTSPDTKIHAIGTGGVATAHFDGNGEDQLTISGTANAAAETAGIAFRYGGSLSGNKIARILAYTQSGGGGDFLFQTASSGVAAWDTKMTILKGGNVGIGTTSPGAKLEIENSGTDNGLFIDQNGEGTALLIDTEATTSDGLVIQPSNMTTGDALKINNVASFTSGNALNIDINSAGMTGSVAYIRQDHASASGHLLELKNDGTGKTITANGKIAFTSLPTSSAGLSAGDIWNNSGVLNIV